MTIYCDLQMTTEQALAMLEFVQLSRGGQLPAHLVELFDDLERQLQDGIELEAEDRPWPFSEPRAKH
ncbi:hypothetical protein [Klebsiella pneumoniae]|uniref:hypothetical protein n=1 Tax=Klebsiella pneumoniae TaxID=573 RepID=UPI0032DA2F62